MSFRWDDFVPLAAELSQVADSDPLCEAKWRTAVSRAYYAAFHRVGQFYRERHGGQTPASEVLEYGGRRRELGTHEALIVALAQGSDLERKVGLVLSRMRRARRWADYQSRPVSADQATAEVDRAARLLAALR